MSFKARQALPIVAVILATFTTVVAAAPIDSHKKHSTTAPADRDLVDFTARAQARQAAEQRAFDKKEAQLKRQMNGICSNC